jgi:hypothetical protein
MNLNSPIKAGQSKVQIWKCTTNLPWEYLTES